MTRSRKVVITGIAIFAAVFLVLFFWPERTKVSPPTLSVLSVENAGVLDDNDVEMWLLTLCISNQDQIPNYPGYGLYVEDGNRPIEAQVQNRWVPVHGERFGCFIAPNGRHQILFVVPAGTTSCRAIAKYTGSRLRKGRLILLAERLPRSVWARLPNKFWRWAGYYPIYGPDSRWREIELEVPIPPAGSNSVFVPAL